MQRTTQVGLLLVINNVMVKRFLENYKLSFLKACKIPDVNVSFLLRIFDFNQIILFNIWSHQDKNNSFFRSLNANFKWKKPLVAKHETIDVEFLQGYSPSIHCGVNFRSSGSAFNSRAHSTAFSPDSQSKDPQGSADEQASKSHIEYSLCSARNQS